jgi:streptogramin lyase
MRRIAVAVWSLALALVTFGFSVPAGAAGLTVTASVAFGNADFGVTGASSVKKSVRITNPLTGQPVTGLSVHITGADAGEFAISNNGCTSTLAKDTNCTVMLTFTPAALGTRTASLAVSDTTSANAGSATLSGVGVPGKLTISPLTSNFSNIVVGATSAAKTTTLKNLTGATLHIDSVAPSGDFSKASDGCSGNDLAPSATCAITATFSPTQTGALSGNMSISDDAASSPQSVTLEGTGILAKPTFSSPSISFGRVREGTMSQPNIITLFNPNVLALQITSITTSGPFAANGAACGSQIGAGGNCQISMTFDPTSDPTETGTSETGKLIVADNATGSPQTLSLSGVALGTAPSPTPTATATATATVTATATAPATVTATPTATATPSIAFVGTVEGGLGPVSGATVTLFAAGTAYGSGATSLGSTTTYDGYFILPYIPPATPTVLYLVSLGGNAGPGSNADIGLMGVLGMSNALPQGLVTINELTTVAAEWALAQFIDSTGQIVGAPSSNTTGFVNAVNQVQANLVDISTGSPASFWSSQLSGDGLERMVTIANILAACVESSGSSSSACTTLVSGVGTTLTTAHMMATEPFANVAAFFALQGASPPFADGLSTQPDGFEIAIGLGYDPDPLLETFFDAPDFLAIDAAGNVWVTNTGMTFGNPSVTELTPSGGLVGNFNNSNTIGANFDFPEGVAIDAVSNVWVANYDGNSVTVLPAGCTPGIGNCTAGNYNNFIGANNFNGPVTVAIDAADNVWVANNGGNSLTELISSHPGDAANFSSGFFDGPAGMAIDAADNVWVVNEGGNSLTELGFNSSGFFTFTNNLLLGANFDFPQGVAIDPAGNVWVTNTNGNSVTEFIPSEFGVLPFNNDDTTGANFDGPAGVAIDAAGNVWVANSLGNSVTELPAGCFPGSCTANNLNASGASFKGPDGVAIDASGNVWVANPDNNTVAEILGVARPVLTPQVACLKKTPPQAVCLP